MGMRPQYLAYHKWLGTVFVLLVIMLLLGCYIGIRILRNKKNSIKWARIYVGFQIPAVLTPLLTYKFYAGVAIFIYILAKGFYFDFKFGAELNLFILQKVNNMVLGINLLAVVVFILLTLVNKMQRKRD